MKYYILMKGKTEITGIIIKLLSFDHERIPATILTTHLNVATSFDSFVNAIDFMNNNFKSLTYEIDYQIVNFKEV